MHYTSTPSSSSFSPSSFSSSSSARANHALHHRKGSIDSPTSAFASLLYRSQLCSGIDRSSTNTSLHLSVSEHFRESEQVPPSLGPHDASLLVHQKHDTGPLTSLDSSAELEIRVIGNRAQPRSGHADHSSLASHRGSSCERRVVPEADIDVLQPVPIPDRPSAPTTPVKLLMPPPRQKRLQSLDILRGITIILMVLVNTQGADPFIELMHSPWFGYTLADWVFPNFVFMMGMTVAIVLPSSKLAIESPDPSAILCTNAPSTEAPPAQKRRQTRIWMTLKIFRRSIVLFALGVALSALELIGESEAAPWVRIPGVLQRIAFCYFVLATCVLWAPVHSRAAPSQTNVHPLEPPRRVLVYSRYIQVGLPAVCTILWFVLTYTVQSTATQPIQGCEYPVSELSTGSNILVGGPPARGQLSPEWCTAQAFLDTILFSQGRDPNMPVFDSEGTIGTLMAVVTAWCGWMTGAFVMEQQRQQRLNDGQFVNQTQFQKVDEVGQTWVQSVGSPTIGNRAKGIDREASAAIIAKDIQSVLPDKLIPKNSAGHHLSVTTSWNSKMSASANSTQPIDDLVLSERRRSSLLAHLGVLFMRGICAMFAGIVLGWFLPVCKGLWTPSFTLYSAGISTNVLGILLFVYDIAPIPKTTFSPLPSPSSYAGCPSWSSRVLRISVHFLGSLTRILLCCGQGFTQVLVWYGRNPTLIYLLTELVKLVLEKIHVDGKYDWIQSVWSYLFFNSFITFMSAPWASLVFSVVYISLFAPLMWYLNKKGIYLRV